MPLAYNVFFFFGFYNFDYSLAALMLVVGYWLRQGNRFGYKQLLALALLVTILYFCHIVSFAIAAVLLVASATQTAAGRKATGALLAAAVAFAVIGVARAFFGRTAAAGLAGAAGLATAIAVVRHRKSIDWPGLFARLPAAALPLTALAPAAVLSVAFLTQESGERRGELAVNRALRLVDWAGVFHATDRWLSIVVIALFAAATAPMVWAKRRAWDRSDAVLATAIVTAGLAMVVPAAVGGGSYVVDRVDLLAAMLWALWVALQLTLPFAQRLNDHFRRAIMIIAGAAAAAILARDVIGMRTVSGRVSEYVEVARHLPGGARVLPAEYAEGNLLAAVPPANSRPWLSPVKFMIHAVGWAAADRLAVDVTNYEAGTGYFPTLFQPGLQFYTSTAQNTPPGDYVQATGGHGAVDYVILWTGGQPPRLAQDVRFAAQLNAGFHEVARSNGRGWAVLYARNTPPIKP